MLAEERESRGLLWAKLKEEQRRRAEAEGEAEHFKKTLHDRQNQQQPKREDGNGQPSQP